MVARYDEGAAPCGAVAQPRASAGGLIRALVANPLPLIRLLLRCKRAAVSCAVSCCHDARLHARVAQNGPSQFLHAALTVWVAPTTGADPGLQPHESVRDRAG
jgi:hypothetical protein